MTTSRIEKITQRIGKIFWDDFNAKAEELVRKEVTKAHQAGKKEGIDEAVEKLLKVQYGKPVQSNPYYRTGFNNAVSTIFKELRAVAESIKGKDDTIKALETKKKDNE